MPRLTTCTLLTALLFPLPTLAQCPDYSHYSQQRHPPYSTGTHALSYARPIPPCRTFVSPEVEDTIERLRHVIADPDLFRLFENSWPSTLDTTIAWRGWANASLAGVGKDGLGYGVSDGAEQEEELTFVITGDIEAMWLRDSANQLQAYTSVLRANSSFDSLAGLFRGAINLQARYILEHPFCNAFQAPPESGIKTHSSANSDRITPSYDFYKVFSCQWELDSVASFLQLSTDYFQATGDHAFFARSSNWTAAVEIILETADSMTIDSYNDAGTWQHTPYTYCAPYGGTPINDCNGSPHRGGTGLVRSFHRPSDDACTFQYLIPSNMMFSASLNASSYIAELISPSPSRLTQRMRHMSTTIRNGIETFGLARDAKHGTIYAYEVDGYGSANLMDDANIPSLLSAPFLHYTTPDDPVYQNTRRKILSRDNPYYAWGPRLRGVGSPHTLPGRVWPMAMVVAVLTSEDEDEILEGLRGLVGCTAGFGVLHESVDVRRTEVWSRQWFSWANGLFGQMILDLEKRKPHLLRMSFQ